MTVFRVIYFKEIKKNNILKKIFNRIFKPLQKRKDFLIDKDTITINPNITSKTYNCRKNNARSYVYNKEINCEFIFQGISSDLWEIIVSTNSIKEMLRFAAEKEINENEINNFLADIFSNNLITDDNTSLITDVYPFEHKIILENDKEGLNEFYKDKSLYTSKSKLSYQYNFE